MKKTKKLLALLLMAIMVLGTISNVYAEELPGTGIEEVIQEEINTEAENVTEDLIDAEIPTEDASEQTVEETETETETVPEASTPVEINSESETETEAETYPPVETEAETMPEELIQEEMEADDVKISEEIPDKAKAPGEEPVIVRTSPLLAPGDEKYTLVRNTYVGYVGGAPVSQFMFKSGSDEYWGFCCNHSLYAASAGSTFSLQRSYDYGCSENEDLFRKLLWYSDQCSYGPDVITSCEASMGLSVLMGDSGLGAGAVGNAAINAIRNLASPPAGFVASNLFCASYLQQAFVWSYNPVPENIQLTLYKYSTDRTTEEFFSVNGAQYAVYDSKADAEADVNRVKTLTIRSNKAIAEFEDKGGGNYYVKEVKVPTGYALDQTIYSFSANASASKKATITSKDKPIGYRVAIMKINSKWEPLGGAVFGLYKADGTTLVKKVTTASNGRADFEEVIEGTYVIKEISPPAGYALDSNSYTIKIPEDLEGNRIERFYWGYLQRDAGKDEIAGNLTLLKDKGYQAVISKFVNAAEYQNKNKTDREFIIDTYRAILGRVPSETEISSKLERLTSGRDAGKWDLFAASEFIDAAETKTRFMSFIQKIVNKQIVIKVKKTSANPDCTTGNPLYSLEGAVFEIRKQSDNTLMGTITTNVNGEGECTGSFTAGETYVMTEVTAPKGYKLSTESKTFTIPEGFKERSVTWADEPYGDPLIIQVSKKDAYAGEGDIDRIALNGAIFEVSYFNTFDNIDGLQATRTWYIETGKNRILASLRGEGLANLYEDSLTSFNGTDSDPLYYFNGTVGIPMGTVRIREVYAPAGYELDPTEYIEVITPEMAEVSEAITLNYEINENPFMPEVKTTAISVETGSNLSDVSSTSVLEDIVELNNLVVGRTYTLKGQLIDKEAKTPIILADGNDFVSVTFKADSADMTVTVPFTVDTIKYAGRVTVCTEELYVGKEIVPDTKIAEHTDLDDADQTIYIPGIHTLASINESVPNKDGKISLRDEVSLTALKEGEEYTLKTRVWDKTDQKFITDEAEYIFTYTGQAKETIDVLIDITSLAGHDLVFFEELYYNKTKVAEHVDENDKGQTVKIPLIHTLATVSGEKVTYVKGEVTLKDEVSLKNLEENKEYILKTRVWDKTDQKFITDEAEHRFTYTGQDKEIIEVIIDTTDLGNHELVFFESMYYNGVKIAEHADENDKDQTIRVGKVGTLRIRSGAGSVKTGDPSDASGAWLMLIISLSAGAFLLCKKKKITKLVVFTLLFSVILSTNAYAEEEKEIERTFSFETDQEDFKALEEEVDSEITVEGNIYTLKDVDFTTENTIYEKVIYKDVETADPSETIEIDDVTYNLESKEVKKKKISCSTEFDKALPEEIPPTMTTTYIDSSGNEIEAVCDYKDTEEIEGQIFSTDILLTYENYDADYFLWNGHRLENNGNPNVTDISADILRQEGINDGYIVNAYWSGDPYVSGGTVYRDAILNVNYYGSTFKVNYETEVEDGGYIAKYWTYDTDSKPIHTVSAKAIYTLSVNEEKATFFTPKTVAFLAGGGILVLAILAAIIIKKMKRLSSEAK